MTASGPPQPRRRLLLLGLLTLVALPLVTASGSGVARAAPPDLVVTARLVRAERVPACGILHAIGDVLYERVSVEQGTLEAIHFIGVHSCPDMSLRSGLVKLQLSLSRPRGWPAKAAADFGRGLPRYHVLSSEPLASPVTRDSGRLIGRERRAIAADRKETGERDGWVLYGPDLSIRFVEDRAVQIRATLSAGMRCNEASRWMGFRGGRPRSRRAAAGCLWPQGSVSRRLGPGLDATFDEGVFQLGTGPGR